MNLSRRTVLSGLGASALAPLASARVKAKLVVIGGGFGGASAAMALRRLMPSADVTLIEPNETYYACPFSNLVVAGGRELSAQAFSYGGLSAAGINVIADRATGVDSEVRLISLARGKPVTYDRLILSPGIDFREGGIEGYSGDALTAMPHAWKAGTQTTLLRDQLMAMEDGGTVVIAAPSAPYRCPPGPYERASLIAHYLKIQKPRSKLIILDPKPVFSKKPVFMAAWNDMYADHLEWRGPDDDGRVSRVDADAMTLETDFESIKADVANVIPPQRAGEIAMRAGVADATGWCPVNATSFESTLVPNIHVIGDAAITNPMPKSAFAANLQAKICAVQVARLMAGLAPQPTVLANTCYSYVSPDKAVSIAGVYRNAGGVFSSVEGAGGLSAADPMTGEREAEAAQAVDWFEAISREAFG